MESNNLDSKYQKLATEYSKIRAQANVLKKAVLDEQSKNSNLRESLRQKETALRRAEQEVDSLGFRNKQLEHRVASLQDDFEKESKKSNKNQKPNKIKNSTGPGDTYSESLLAEELQKKILENAQLTSLIDDKDRELLLCNERIKELELQVSKRLAEHTETERKLRREVDTLTTRNSELETKLVEAASMIGSEDALSVSGSDNTPLHTNSSSSEDRIAYLEKEVFHWRTQYEILKISELPPDKNKEKVPNGPSSSNHESNAPPETNKDEAIKEETSKEEPSKDESREQVLYNHFSKKFEELLRAKCVAESRLTSYLTECENLQNSLEILMNEMKEKDLQLNESARSIENLEGDLNVTRKNYEEQISVLTEQVISLSDMVASSK